MVCYADLVNHLVGPDFPNYPKHHNNILKSEAKYYIWDDSHLWSLCIDQVIRGCIPNHEFQLILHFCHTPACGGHFGPIHTTMKVFDSSLYWPTLFRDPHAYCKTCEQFQRIGYIS